MTRKLIRFNQPCTEGNELDYIAHAINEGHLSGDGEYTSRCQAFFEQEVGTAKALLTTSCTHALEMAAILINFDAGEEVIIPSFTFVSTANAFLLHGAKPVFADIRPDTLNLDERQLEKLISPKTRAIVPVHYAGVGCEMDTIMEIASRHNLIVAEDNSHGLFGTYKNKPLGSFGKFSTLSFHETKNVTCGEGGALLLNDPSYCQRAEIIREKGTNRSQFFRGEIDKYSWVDIGSSYLPADILAAFLYGQLEMKNHIQNRRKNIWEYYYKNLTQWAGHHGVKLPYVPSYCQQSYHMFYLLMPSLEERTAFIEHLKKKQIKSVFHYLPLHLSTVGTRLGGQKGDCPVCENISDCLVRLPFYNNLSSSEQDFIIEAIQDFDQWRT